MVVVVCGGAVDVVEVDPVELVELLGPAAERVTVAPGSGVEESSRGQRPHTKTASATSSSAMMAASQAAYGERVRVERRMCTSLASPLAGRAASVVAFTTEGATQP